MLLGGSPDVLVRVSLQLYVPFDSKCCYSYSFLSNVIKRTEICSQSKNTLFDKVIKCRGLQVAAELPHRQANFLIGGLKQESPG